MVCETVTSPIGMSAYSRCMSSIVSIATPHLPTSPTHSSSSLSRPMRVGRSKAVERPVLAAVEDLACSKRYLNRLFVSSADPNPANCRMVHRRVLYPCGNRPRVNGYCPGAGRSRARFRSESGITNCCSAGPYAASSTMPEIVTACGSITGTDGLTGRDGVVVMVPL